MKIAVISLTAGGGILCDRLCSLLTGSTGFNRHAERQQASKVSQLLEEIWPCYDALVCIMAAGIVVRSIAPLLKNKAGDPAVLVLDEKGQFVISLLSGHLGGANQLANEIARRIGATPVITTSSDTLKLVALDLWAHTQGLAVPNARELTKISAQLVNNGSLKVYTDMPADCLPKGLYRTEKIDCADIIITNSLFDGLDGVFFRPRNLVVGTGCNRGTEAGEFEDALTEILQELSLHRDSIRNLASVDKKNDETGLLQFARENSWSIDFFSKTEINELQNIEISFAALQAIGAIGVAEPCALLSAKSSTLLCRKRKWKNVTMAIAQVPFMLSEQALAPLTR